MVQITALYAALLMIVYIVLSMRVIAIRRSDGISLGDGGNQALNRRIRAHGNFAENAPIGLIVLGLVELNDASGWVLHLLGLSLLLGRVLHGAALSRATPWPLGRMLGMVLTYTMQICAVVVLLAQALS